MRRQLRLVSSRQTKPKAPLRRGGLHHPVRGRKELDRLFTSILSRLITSPPEEIDQGIREALRNIGAVARADRAFILYVSGRDPVVRNCHEWCARGKLPLLKTLLSGSMIKAPWLAERMRRLETVRVTRVALLPEEAAAEADILRKYNVDSLLAAPMAFGGALLVFGLASSRPQTTWPADISTLLTMVGGVFANAIDRKQVAERMLRNAAEVRAIIQALPIRYFRLEPDGTILDYNVGKVGDLYVPPEAFLGRRAQDIVPPHVGRQLDAALTRIRSTGSTVRIEYPLPMPEGEQIFEACLAPLEDGQVTVVVRDITGTRQVRTALERVEAQHGSLLEMVIRQLRPALSAVVSGTQRLLAGHTAPRTGLQHLQDHARRGLEHIEAISSNADATRAIRRKPKRRG